MDCLEDEECRLAKNGAGECVKKCEDSDGDQYFAAGAVELSGGAIVLNDFCIDEEKLNEWTCDQNGNHHGNEIKCAGLSPPPQPAILAAATAIFRLAASDSFPSRCENGACTIPEKKKRCGGDPSCVTWNIKCDDCLVCLDEQGNIITEESGKEGYCEDPPDNTRTELAANSQLADEALGDECRLATSGSGTGAASAAASSTITTAAITTVSQSVTWGVVSAYEGQYNQNEYLEVHQTQIPADEANVVDLRESFFEVFPTATEEDYMAFSHFFPGNTGFGAINILECPEDNPSSNWLFILSQDGIFVDAVPSGVVCQDQIDRPKIVGQFDADNPKTSTAKKYSPPPGQPEPPATLYSYITDSIYNLLNE
jgi:hypothetical protein